MKRLILALLALCLISTPVWAASKTLKFAWQQELPDPNDLAGWKLYKSTTGSVPWELQETILYTAPATEYQATSTITVPSGQVTILFFVMTAFDQSQNESGHSNQVSATLDFLSPKNPVSLSVIVTNP